MYKVLFYVWAELRVTELLAFNLHVVLDTLANTIFSQVADMTGTCWRHVARQQHDTACWLFKGAIAIENGEWYISLVQTKTGVRDLAGSLSHN
jgi:hypothetical protein